MKILSIATEGKNLQQTHILQILLELWNHISIFVISSFFLNF
jgi:hypothetical protein